MGAGDDGCIISRRAPCAGCSIPHDGDECGKQFACIVDISVQEVFDAMFMLREPGRSEAAKAPADSFRDIA